VTYNRESIGGCLRRPEDNIWAQIQRNSIYTCFFPRNHRFKPRYTYSRQKNLIVNTNDLKAFGGIYYRHLYLYPDDWGRRFVRNADIHLPEYTVSYPTGPQLPLSWRSSATERIKISQNKYNFEKYHLLGYNAV
jgi:hypothetical protein